MSSAVINASAYPGDQRCRELLEQAQSAVSFEELRAAAMGFLLSAEEYEGDVLFELINGDEEVPVSFETEEELEEFTSTILGLWGELSADLKAGKTFQFSEFPNSSSENDRDSVVEAAELRAVEVDFFMGSLIAGGIPFGDEPGEELPMDKTEWMPACLEESFDKLIDHLEGIESGDHDDWQELRSIVSELDERFAETYPSYTETLPAYRDKLMAEALAARTPAKNPMRHVGRNDPCPCGSGKKFKSCCLQ